MDDIEVEFQGFEKDTSLAGTAMSKKFQVMEMDKSMKSSHQRISGGKKPETVSRGPDDLENNEYNDSDVNKSRK